MPKGVRGFQPGNQEGARKRLFHGALQRAIAQDNADRVRKAAERLLDLASEGEPWAVRELADRLDGKPAQVIAGDAENPLQAAIEVVFRKPDGA